MGLLRLEVCSIPAILSSSILVPGMKLTLIPLYLPIIWLTRFADNLPADEKISFNFQIKPILAEHCFKCHGQDENRREGELRLDVREAALEKRAIVPGQPDQSELIRRLTTHDKDDILA